MKPKTQFSHPLLSFPINQTKPNSQNPQKNPNFKQKNNIYLQRQRKSVCVSLQSASEEDDKQGGIIPGIALDILMDSQPGLSRRGRKRVGIT